MKQSIINLDCIDQLAELCQKASSAILFYYHHPDKLNVQNKSNNTPVTDADLAANDIISDGLPRIFNLPIVSEEAEQLAGPNCTDYWLIDPIDGTSSFIARTGQFCIAIARIKNNSPVLGFIYSPLTHEYWYAIEGCGSYKVNKNNITAQLPLTSTMEPIAVTTSRKEQNQRMADFTNIYFPNAQMIAQSSALKFCLLAENKANIYPKLSSTTCEWDTAAGDIILREMGGGIYYYPEQFFKYGARETFINPPFIAYNHSKFKNEIPDWKNEIAHLILKTPSILKI